MTRDRCLTSQPLQSLGERPRERSDGPHDVVLGRPPPRDGEPDRRPPVPRRATHPCLATGLHGRESGARRRVVREAEEHLVEHDLVQHLGTGEGRDLLGERSRVAAAAVDELADPGPAERADRRVDGHRARAPGELGAVGKWLAALGLVDLDEVRRGRAHRAPVRRGIGAERDAAVVGHVQPLVRVGRPGVRSLGSVDEVAELVARARPESERAVEVQPRPPRLAGVRDRVEVLERAGVHLAGLGDDDRRAVRLGEDVGQERCPHASLVVDRDEPHLPGAEPQEAERAIDGDVALLARYDPKAGAALEALLADAPPGALEHRVARDRERGRVRHLAARDEGERRRCREPEQLLDPRAGGLFDNGGRWREEEQTRVLIPCRDEPVGGQRGGKRPADHEAEVPTGAHRSEPRLPVAYELLDHVEVG